MRGYKEVRGVAKEERGVEGWDVLLVDQMELQM